MQTMNRILTNIRQPRIPLKGEGVRSVLGYVFSEITQHRCMTTTTTTTNWSSSLETHASIMGASCQQQQQQPLRMACFPLHQRVQCRSFVFDSRKARKTKRKKNPFQVLKIPPETLYKDAKKKFLRIAMSNHPDTHQDGLSDEEKEAMRDRFIEARMAFERLVEDPDDGMAILVEEKEDRESNFDSWFKNETGLKNPFDVDIDPETMKEVAEMTEKLGGSQGMDRDGGMWALARMVTSAVRSGGDASSILRLESGDVKDRPGMNPDGKLRRRRKR